MSDMDALGVELGIEEFSKYYQKVSTQHRRNHRLYIHDCGPGNIYVRSFLIEDACYRYSQ